MIVHDQVDWIPRARHSDKLATEAVKIWADGGMSSRTAAIHGTYPVPPHGSGILFFSRDELTAMVREFDTNGFQVAVHAQGDRAIETVLDAYAAIPDMSGPGRNPRRHRIEHAGAMYPLTVIFAFIPPIVAWLINMIVVYLTASIGVSGSASWAR